MSITKKDDAVSAVISTILLVAITVIVAAVVATFVFGMAGNVPKTKLVAGKVSHADERTVTVTYLGGDDASTCTAVSWILTKSDGSALSSFIMLPTTESIVLTGTEKTFHIQYPGKKRVLATATFSDGTQQVILDNTF